MKASLLPIVCLSLCLSGFGLATDVYFSPDGGVRDQIIKRINRSKSKIDIAMYSFSSGEIAQALAEAKKRGVKVRVIRDKIQSTGKNDENEFLESHGILVEIRTGKGRGIMHDKFAVFDGQEVFTGSYNWTENAEINNHENALFTDEQNVIKAFQEEFEKLWKLPAPAIREKTTSKLMTVPRSFRANSKKSPKGTEGVSSD